MSSKKRRTFSIDQAVDNNLTSQAKASRKSISRAANEALNEYLQIDQESLKSIRRLAGVLEVEVGQVLNSLLKICLQDIETRKQQHNPIALFVDDISRLGGSI